MDPLTPIAMRLTHRLPLRAHIGCSAEAVRFSKADMMRARSPRPRCAKDRLSPLWIGVTAGAFARVHRLELTDGPPGGGLRVQLIRLRPRRGTMVDLVNPFRRSRRRWSPAPSTCF